MIEAFHLWVIYDHPRDKPGVWVARRWEGMRASAETFESTVLEEVRTHLRGLGMTPIGRQPGDDDAIFEVWV